MRAWLRLSAVALMACGAPVPSAPSRAPEEAGSAVASAAANVSSEVEEEPAPWREEIYRLTWPSLDATLLGVDTTGRRAFIKLRTRKPARYVIDTVNIDSGERLSRWEASPAAAPRLADYDARFAPLDGDHDQDLTRLAEMVSVWSTRSGREGSAWPVADASPDGKQVVFMRGPTGGREGDWLFLHDVATARATRIGRRTIASYDAKFSPDGEHLAWRGCIGRRPCRYFLYLSTVTRAAQGHPPHRIAAVRDPRGPVWSPDGDAVYALAANAQGERCVTRTTLPSRRPWRLPETTPLFCDAKLSSFVLSPGGKAMLSAKRDGHHAEITWRTSKARTTGATGSTDPVAEVAVPEASVQLQQTSELSLSDRGLVLADHQKGLLALDLKQQRRRLYESEDGGFVFVPNVHWLTEATAIMLEKSFSDGSVRLVRVDVAKFLEG